MIVDPEQAVEVMNDLLDAQDFAFGRPQPPRERAADLSADLRRVYDAITEDCTAEEVAANGSLDAGRVASGLAELELEGLVVSSNGRWRRC